jgi:hypothetical protein
MSSTHHVRTPTLDPTQTLFMDLQETATMSLGPMTKGHRPAERSNAHCLSAQQLGHKLLEPSIAALHAAWVQMRVLGRARRRAVPPQCSSALHVVCSLPYVESNEEEGTKGAPTWPMKLCCSTYSGSWKLHCSATCAFTSGLRRPTSSCLPPLAALLVLQEHAISSASASAGRRNDEGCAATLPIGSGLGSSGARSAAVRFGAPH